MRWAQGCLLPLALSHRLHGEIFRKNPPLPPLPPTGEASALLKAAKERAKRDQETDRAEVLQQIRDCPHELQLNMSAEEIVERFDREFHRPPSLTINFDAEKWVKVAEENPKAGHNFESFVQNLWQVAMLPHPPLDESRLKRNQQVYSYANQRYDTEKWFFGFTLPPESAVSAVERPVSAAPGLFGGAKNGNALTFGMFGDSALFLEPHVWNRSTIVGADLKVAFGDLGQPKDYDATFPKWPLWKPRPKPKSTDPILQIPNLQAAGGLPWLGTLDHPLAALKLTSCYDFKSWIERLRQPDSMPRINYLEVNIFGGVSFAEDVAKVVITVPMANSSVTELDLNAASALRSLWAHHGVSSAGPAEDSMETSVACKMWRLAQQRHIRRLSWCLSVQNDCVREVDATHDVSCVTTSTA